MSNGDGLADSSRLTLEVRQLQTTVLRLAAELAGVVGLARGVADLQSRIILLERIVMAEHAQPGRPLDPASAQEVESP